MIDGDLLTHFRAARRRVVKWAHFLPVYERLLASHRGHAITLVEVGVGDGGSLEVWRSYLGPSARIIGIDLNPETKRLESEGFEIIIGDQSDPEFWAECVSTVGAIDVLIDDGGHTGVQQVVTVACGLPHVRDGGVIIVEDTHTSYLPKDYPAPTRFGFMKFAQHVVDVLHLRNPFVSTAIGDTAGLGRAIHRVAFYESMVVFHVDRRLCGPSKMIDAGVEELPPAPQSGTLRSRVRAALESQPLWLQSAVQSVRGVLRGPKRIADANRVKRYFR